jgi:hypothetical protein
MFFQYLLTRHHFRSLDHKTAFTRATVRTLGLQEPSTRYQVAGRQPLWPKSGSNRQRLGFYCTLKLRHWSDTFCMRVHMSHSSAHCQNETHSAALHGAGTRDKCLWRQSHAIPATSHCGPCESNQRRYCRSHFTNSWIRHMGLKVCG